MMSKPIYTKHPNKIDNTNQSTLDIKGTVVRPFKFNGSIAHEAYVEFIVTNRHAFTLWEEPAFRKFLLLLQPLYKPLGATAVKIMQAFVELKLQVIPKLGNCNLALTTDLWTSPNHSSFMGITAAMWDENSDQLMSSSGLNT
ncbi:uncharacterized protein LOC123470494 [Daphnia magna]|uniref:uncharacterized protein LOC123470494 n=1 Tax=Daphnia magna TaxID=35525 RepID=UPI001E1BD623|nr:uncharacterized protein LOC123470494 [Daphnia magna]